MLGYKAGLAIIVEELISKLGLEIDSEAMGVLQKFKSAVSNGMLGISAAAGAAALGFAAIVGSAAKAADNIGDVSERLGETPKALQELKFAAERAEVSFESLQSGLKFIAKNAVEAANGNTELAKAFAGVGLRDVQGRIKPASEILASLADKLKALPDDATRTNLAMKLLGRGGAELVPLLKKGSQGIAELSARANELGVVFSDEAVAAAGEFDDSLKDVRDSLTGLRNAVGVPFFKAFTAGLKLAASALVKLRPLTSAIARGLKEVGEEMGAILSPLGKFAAYLYEAFSSSAVAKFLGALDAFSTMKAVMLGLGVVASIFAAQMVGAALATIASWLAAAAPFIIVAAAIGFIVDEIYNFIEGNETVLGTIISWANFFDPTDNIVIRFFKAALALLFDLTDPKKWSKLGDVIAETFGMLGDFLLDMFLNLGSKIGDVLASALDSVPLLKDLMKSGTFKGMLGGDLTASLQAEGAKAALPPRMPSFSGGATGPDAAAAISTGASNTTNKSSKIEMNVTNHISGLGMSKEQVEEMQRDHQEKTMRQARAALKGG